MASEYLKWKYKDVKPEEKRELTPEEKRKNWWYYHKWHVVIALALVGIAGSIVWNAVTQVKPDYRIAYVGEDSLPEDTAAALEAGFAALGEDLNGDGKVVALLSQYASHSAVEAQAAAAAEVKLMADIMNGESYFFLLEDPEGFQQAYRSLCLLDGSLPEENDRSAEGTYLAWSRCPTLTGMELGDYSYALMGGTAAGDSQELLSKLFIARRGFWTDDGGAYREGCDALWEKIVEGAEIP